MSTGENFRDRADCGTKHVDSQISSLADGAAGEMGPGGAWTITASEQCPCLEMDPLRHP